MPKALEGERGALKVSNPKNSLQVHRPRPKTFTMRAIAFNVMTVQVPGEFSMAGRKIRFSPE